MSTNTVKDQLFATPMADIGGFVFDQRVVDVFPDMLDRSVPGYRSVIAQSGLLAEKFARDNTHCYDLGCSLGATLLAMRHSIRAQDCTIVGVDNSEAMIKRCHEMVATDTANTLEQSQALPEVQLHCEDIRDIHFEPASVVALNFTLQFVEPGARHDLLRSIADATVKGGALILSEKIAFDDPVMHELYIDRYHAFKRANGYSELEISQKRNALENVLVPDTLETHRQRLLEAGYQHCSVWFQCFNFVSLIAIR